MHKCANNLQSFHFQCILDNEAPLNAVAGHSIPTARILTKFEFIHELCSLDNASSFEDKCQLY